MDYCRELDTLNLSQNHIRKIENCGVEVLPNLNTLNLASNYLKDYESLKILADCKTLSVLDLSNNRIDDILVVKVNKSFLLKWWTLIFMQILFPDILSDARVESFGFAG